MKKVLIAGLVLIVQASIGQNIADLYERVNSSVVVINIVSVAPEVVREEIELVAQQSSGSGVLISDDGLIWTAAHVVQSAELVEVEFLDGDIYEAQVLTSNQQADVALIKVAKDFNLKNKHIAKIGNSDQLRVGEDVVVLGAPHGFKQSLSRGILSGRYLPEELANNFVNIEFLQTDAAINPGNSGGPLFNLKGEVMGIASRIFTNSGGFEGIGFAVSSNVANKILMEAPGLWSGMQTRLLSEGMAAILNVPQSSGLLVESVSSKGAGSALKLKAGFIPANINGIDLILGGDVILEIAGVQIKDNNSLFLIREQLRNKKIGEDISITILRQGKIGTSSFTKQ